MENVQYPNGILSICSHGYWQHRAMFWTFDARNVTEQGSFDKPITT